MTEFQALLRALEARGQLAAKAARARPAAALVAAASPLTADSDGEMVTLTAPGLRGRAHGTRRRLPDAAIQSLVRPGGFR